MKLKNSIVARLNLYTALSIVVTVGTMGALVHATSAARVRESISERNVLITTRGSSEISVYLDGSFRQLEIAADALPLFLGSTGIGQVYLENITLKQERFRSLRLVSLNGEVLSTGDLSFAAAEPGPVDVSAAFEAFDNGPYLSDITYTAEGFPYVTIGVPVTNIGTERQALFADLDLRDIWRIVDEITVGTTGRALLMTADGEMIYHRDRRRVLSAPPFNPAELEAGASGSSGSRTRIVSQEGQPDSLLTWTALQSGWVLVLEQETREAFYPVAQTMADAVVLIVIGIAVSVGIGTLLAGRTLRPLMVLTHVLSELDVHNLDYRVPTNSGDEIGQLSTAFNSMLDRLQARTLELSESEGKYRLLTENASDLIFALDTDGRALFLNRMFETTTGYNREEYVGRHFSDLLTPEGRKKFDAHLAVLRGDGTRNTTELDVSLVPNRGAPVETEIRLVRAEYNRQSAAVFGVARDVTGRNQMQEHVIQSEKLSSLGEIIAGVAHELNNPLTTIIGYSEMLRRNPDGSQLQDKATASMHREASRAARIVKSLLSFSRKCPLEKRLFQVNDLLEEILELRAYEMNLHQIHITRRLDPDLPAAYVDPNQLRQVFMNLVNNAIQALRCVRSQRILVLETEYDREYVRVSVRDTGPGVDDETKSRIFDPFFTTKNPGEGTGLGLSISLKIAQEHGGTIALTDNDGRGARFTVRLPRTVPTARPSGPIEVSHILRTPCRVLVVDDEVPIQEMLRETFERRGCTVEVAGDGKQALEKVRSDEFDAIICDMRMPVADGWTFYQWIKDEAPDAAAGLVFVTGDLVNADMQAILKRTGVPLVRKPFELEDIVRAMEHNRARRDSAQSPPEDRL